MRSLLLAPLLALTSSGCIFVADDTSPPPVRSDFTGSLVVDWTIDGTTNPDECDQGDAAWLRLVVYTTSGDYVGAFEDDCARFSTSIELDPGGYYADAYLEDPDGNQRTTTVEIDSFSIRGNDTLSIPIDFPARSFY